MLRSARTIALIRSLMLGTVATFSTVAVSSVLIACDDDTKPEFWVKKLEEHAWRQKSVERLTQFFEDRISSAKKDMNDPEVKALLDLMVEPLVKQYTEHYEEIDVNGRVDIMKLLASTRDKRAEPAFKKAFEEFAKDGRGELEIKWAGRAVGDMKLESVAGPMLAAFSKIRAHSKDGARVYRDYSTSMVELKSPTWVDGLVAHLDHEIPMLKTPKDKKNKLEDYKNELFWQVTAAQVLGEIGDAKAVEPLLKVLLDPAKADVHQTAILALVKLGKPAVDRAIKLVNDDDKKLAEYAIAKKMKAMDAKKPPEDKPHVQMAAIVLGTAGNKAAGDALISAAKNAKDDTAKAIIASNLVKLPPSDATKSAFKDTYDAIEDGATQATLLGEFSTSFYDPGLVDWVMDAGSSAKGSNKDDIQQSAALAAIKLMTPKTARKVTAYVNSKGSKLEKEQLKQAQDVLDACKADKTCYLKEVESGKNQDQKNQFVGIKAGYMLAMEGDTKVRDELVAMIDEIENAAIAYVAAAAIDHLTPNGSTEVADKLDEIVEKNKKAADRDKMLRDKPIRDVSYRIRARAK